MILPKPFASNRPQSIALINKRVATNILVCQLARRRLGGTRVSQATIVSDLSDMDALAQICLKK